MAGDKTYITDQNNLNHRATRVTKVTPTDIVWSRNPNDYTVQVLIDGKWHKAVLTCDVKNATFFDNINIDKALVQGTDGKAHTALIINPVADDVIMSPIPTDDHSTIDGTTTGETALNIYSEEWSDIEWEDNVNVYKVIVTGSDNKKHTALLTTTTGGGSVDVIVKGVSPLVLPDAIADSLSYVKAFGGTTQNGTPTPDAPINIVCNNGTIKVRRQSGLPLDYQKITFVRPDESIDLGIKTTNNTQITTKFYREANIAQYIYFSDSNSSGTTNTTAYTSSGNANWRFDGKTASVGTNINTTYESIQNKDGVWLDGEKKGTYTGVDSFTSTNNLKTGAAPSSSTEGNIRYYSMLVEESGVAVLDLIPVRRLSDSKIGFYNLVNGDFFEATGNVVRGGDIADPVEIYVDGTVETIEDTIGNTATAEMLLKVGNYQDVQSIIDGVVTRNVGVKVFDGTENWLASSTYLGSCYTQALGQTPVGQVICSHFQNASSLSDYSRGKCYKESISFNLWYGDNRTTAVADLKQFLAAQYAAGTPVIVVYPLATETTETVTGQTLQVTDGDNTLEITQASLNGLELEAKYKAGVSLTVQEVENAQLSNDVEVTIQ